MPNCHMGNQPTSDKVEIRPQVLMIYIHNNSVQCIFYCILYQFRKFNKTRIVRYLEKYQYYVLWNQFS